MEILTQETTTSKTTILDMGQVLKRIGTKTTWRFKNQLNVMDLERNVRLKSQDMSKAKSSPMPKIISLYVCSHNFFLFS
jgi:hypothetical protein